MIQMIWLMPCSEASTVASATGAPSRNMRTPVCPLVSTQASVTPFQKCGATAQFGTTASLQAQYVGTRAVNQPYLTQVNGYQTVCQGCFAPFPYRQPTDPRFASVTQFATGANSHYHGLHLTAMKRLGHGLQGQINYTWSHCLDSLEWRFPAVFCRRDSFSSAGRSPPRLWLVRLRHSSQPHRAVCVRTACQSKKSCIWPRTERLAGFGQRILAQLGFRSQS
jgi:hypothetical protein